MRRREAALLAAFLGGHAIRWLWTRPEPVPTMPDAPWNGDLPAVSFLVPGWNAAADIPRFMAAYRTLTYPNRELILCAGGNDGSYDIATDYAAADVRVLEQLPGEGKQGALRKAFAASTGSIIYLTDIDCMPTPAATDNLLRQILQGGKEVITGSCCPIDSDMANGLVQTQWAVERMTDPRQITRTQGILGANTALTRRAVEAAGAFAEPAPSGTDYLLAKQLRRAGLELWFTPGSPMPTAYPSALRPYIRRQARWIRNVYQLGRQHGASEEVGQTLRTLALPYLILVTLIAGLWKPALARIAAGLAVHGVLNRLWYQRRAGLAPRPIAAILHFTVTQLAALQAGLDVARRISPW